MAALSRSADLHSSKMLQVARMSGLVKLRCSGGHLGERQQWAGRDHPREQQMLDLSCLRQAGPVNQSSGKHVTGRRIATRDPMQ